MAASRSSARPATDARARRMSAAVASSAARSAHHSCSASPGLGRGLRRRAARVCRPGPRPRPARRRGRRGPCRAPAVRRAGAPRTRRAGAPLRLLPCRREPPRPFRHGCVRRLAEALVREPADRRQRLLRLGSFGHDEQLVAPAGAEGGHSVQAARADGSAPVGRVGDGHGGVEPGRGAHQQRGRTCVEAQGVAHRHPGRRGHGSGCADRGARRLARRALRSVPRLPGSRSPLSREPDAPPCRRGPRGPPRPRPPADRRGRRPRPPPRRPPRAAPRSAGPRPVSPRPAGRRPARRRGRRCRGP